MFFVKKLVYILYLQAVRFYIMHPFYDTIYVKKIKLFASIIEEIVSSTEKSIFTKLLLFCCDSYHSKNRFSIQNYFIDLQ